MTTIRFSMPEPSEGETQAALIRRLQGRGYLVVRVHSGAFQNQSGTFFRAYTVAELGVSSGFPDVLALRPVASEGGESDAIQGACSR